MKVITSDNFAAGKLSRLKGAVRVCFIQQCVLFCRLRLHFAAVTSYSLELTRELRSGGHVTMCDVNYSL